MTDLLEGFLERFTRTELSLLALFFLLFLLRLFYVFIFYGGIIRGRKKAGEGNQPGQLSLILTFRNEEENLKSRLPAILGNGFNGFELIAVDDFSTDNSLIVLGSLKEQYSNLKVSSLSQETRYSAKLSQNIALKAAGNEWVMVVPPSISAPGPEWLLKIGIHATPKNDVVVNYSNLKRSGRSVNLLYRLESLTQQLRCFGYIETGLPFVYNEENVAFRKNRYFETGGYGSKIKEHYANLELLINSFIHRKKTRIVLSGETAFFSERNVTMEDYFDLLKKQIRIEKRLHPGIQLMLLLNNLMGLLFFPLFVLLTICISDVWFVMAAPAVILAGVHMVIIKIILNHLKEHNLFLTSLGYGLLMPYFKLFYRLYYNLQVHRQKWRSRK